MSEIVYPYILANPSVIFYFKKPRVFDVHIGVYDNMLANFRTKESEEEYAQRTRRVPSAVDEPCVAEIPT